MSDLKWLIAREIPHLRRYARALTRNEVEADDIVQEALEKALRKSGQWRRIGSVRAWLFTTLYRTFLNSRRKAGAQAQPHATDGDMESALVAAGQSEPASQEGPLVWRDVTVALDRLPEEQRAALLLVTLEDLSYDEAAAVLDIPIGTLRSRVSRARESLRQSMDPALEPAAPIRRIK